MAARCLEVTLGSTASLKENKAANKVDPYAVLRLGDVETRTDSECVPGARPVWNHRFNFLLPRDAALDPRDLQVDVWDNSTGVDAFLGSCKVALARVFQRRCLDVVQPVHRQCGKLVGHLRFHLALLLEDTSAGPNTPPLPPPPAPLAPWAHPPAPVSCHQQQQQQAKAEAAPCEQPMAASPEKEAGQSKAESDKDSISDLLDSLKAHAAAIGATGKGGKRKHEEVEEEEEQDSGRMYLAHRQKALTAHPSRPSTPPCSPPTLLPPKKQWKNPPPLEMAPTPSSPPQGNSLGAMERLMGISPLRPLARLASSGCPPDSPVTPFGDFMRPLPPLSDLATPSADAVPSAANQFERDTQRSQEGAASADLSKAPSGKAQEPRGEKEGSMSRCSSGSEWDVEALARLTSIFLSSQSGDGAGHCKEAQAILGNQQALAEALTAALGGSSTAESHRQEEGRNTKPGFKFAAPATTEAGNAFLSLLTSATSDAKKRQRVASS